MGRGDGERDGRNAVVSTPGETAQFWRLKIAHHDLLSDLPFLTCAIA